MMSDEINTFQQTGNYRLAGFGQGKNSSRRLGAYLQPAYPNIFPRVLIVLKAVLDGGSI
jgi:hypothetical protein